MTVWLGGRLRIVQGDITRLALDAIVNAANPTLMGGGGVDGAIHDAAGPGLLEECLALGGANPGEAKRTGGHGLPARNVIHTVGPIWRGGGAGEDGILRSCYRASLALAAELGLQTLAFPAISTGVYGFPRDRAAGIALEEGRNGLSTHAEIAQIIYCCFSASDRELYEATAATVLGG